MNYHHQEAHSEQNTSCNALRAVCKTVNTQPEGGHLFTSFELELSRGKGKICPIIQPVARIPLSLV